MTNFALAPVRLGALAAFKTAVETGSLNQAANLLFLSQSAVSQQIRTLENTLGAELLRRTTKGIEPTVTGRLFYSYCCRIVEESVALERQLRARDEERREVWLGVETVLGEHLLPCALSAFRDANPALQLRLSIDHTHEILDAVRQGGLHMGIVPEREDDPHLSWTHLLDMPLVVICHPSHPLASCDEIEAAELHEHAYIAREPWTKCRLTNTRALALWGIAHDDLDIVAEMKTFAGKKSAVMANVGYSIAPWCGVWREVADGSLSRVAIRGIEPSYPVYLVERAASPSTQPQKVLRDFLESLDWSEFPSHVRE